MKFYRYLFLIIICWACSIVGQAQRPLSIEPQPDVDSLIQVIENSTGDKKISTALILAKNHVRIYPEKTLSQVEDALRLPNLTFLDSIHLEYYKEVCNYFGFVTNEINPKNLLLWINLLDEYKGEKEKKYHFIQAELHTELLWYLLIAERHEEGLRVGLKGANHAIKSEDLELIMFLYYEIGDYYLSSEQYETAIKYFKLSASAITKEHNWQKKYRLTVPAHGLSLAYLALNQIDSAAIYIPYVESQDYKSIVLAKYYQLLNQPLLGIEQLDNYVQSQQADLDNPNAIIELTLLEAIEEKASIYTKMGAFDKAEKAWLKARYYYILHAGKVINAKASKNLYQIYKEKGDHKKALFFFKEFKTILDEILNDKHHRILRGIEDSYSLNLKRKENNHIKQRTAEAQAIIQQQQYFLYFGVFFLFIISLLALIAAYLSTNQKKINQELRLVNQDMSQKSETNQQLGAELNFLVDNTPDAIIRVNKEFDITYYNLAFASLLGGKAAKKGANFFELFHLANEREVYLSGLDLAGQLNFVMPLPESEKYFNIKINTITYPNEGSISEYAIVMEDVTTTKKQAQEKIDLLEESLVIKRKELAAKVMQISKRNADLDSILVKLRATYQDASSTIKLKLSKIIGRLKELSDIEDGWETFSLYFQEIHPGFLSQLKKKGDQLTNNEVRHCTYLKLGLQNNEIADMLNIAVKSVETTHYRIKKKMNMTKDDSLRQLIKNLGSV